MIAAVFPRLLYLIFSQLLSWLTLLPRAPSSKDIELLAYATDVACRGAQQEPPLRTGLQAVDADAFANERSEARRIALQVADDPVARDEALGIVARVGEPGTLIVQFGVTRQKLSQRSRQVWPTRAREVLGMLALAVRGRVLVDQMSMMIFTWLTSIAACSTHWPR